MTTSVRMVALTMPPTIGAAMRRITSDPVPPPSMIGNKPAMIAEWLVLLVYETPSSAAAQD